jgi:hypothetical protein
MVEGVPHLRIVAWLTPKGRRTLRASFIAGTRGGPAALGAGVPLRDVQEAASHADPRTIMRYDNSRVLHQPGEKPQVTWPTLVRVGSGVQRHMPADLGRLANAPAGCMIRPFEGCRPPRGGALGRGPLFGQGGQARRLPDRQQAYEPLLPPRCGLGIRRVLISDVAITGTDQPRPARHLHRRRVHRRGSPIAVPLGLPCEEWPGGWALINWPRWTFVDAASLGPVDTAGPSAAERGPGSQAAGGHRARRFISLKSSSVKRARG